MKERKLHVENMKKAMKELGINQAELARMVTVSRESVSKWMNQEKFPRAGKLLAISRKLKLGFEDLVIQESPQKPQIAFRTHKNARLPDGKRIAAEDTAFLLKSLLPYVERTVFSSPIAQAPSLEYEYIQKVAIDVRKRAHAGYCKLEISHIMELYDQFRIVFIPVLWGEKGDNGLYVHLPDDEITFIYANLEVGIIDFRFWLLHELAHEITTELDGDTCEDFADRLAGAILFPNVLAKETYEELIGMGSMGMQINRIKEIAEAHMISPFTILHEVNAYADSKEIPPIELTIGGAVTNFNRAMGRLTEHLFKGGTPSPETYLSVCRSTFGTRFFDALTRYLQETGADARVVHRLMNIPFADAKGVHTLLVDPQNST